MQVGNDRGDGETPLETEGQVDDDADDHQQERQGTVFGQFLADLWSDELDPAQRGSRGLGIENLQDRLADPRRVLIGPEG